MALLIASRVAGLACVLAAVKAYVCDLSEAVPIPSNAFPTEGLSPGGLLHAAAVYVSGPALEETSYSYTSLEDGVKMIFDTDCSCFLDYLASIYIPSAYVQVPPDDTVSPPVPRARSWTNFFLSLAPDNQYWALIAQVPLIVAGDVFAYELPPGSKDTGHVMVAINQTSTSGPVVASSNPYPDLYSGARCHRALRRSRGRQRLRLSMSAPPPSHHLNVQARSGSTSRMRPALSIRMTHGLVRDSSAA